MRASIPSPPEELDQHNTPDASDSSEFSILAAAAVHDYPYNP